MPTECSAEQFGFAPVEGRKVVAAFDGGLVTSEAGALLLGATDRAISMVSHLAGCFRDARVAGRVEHEIAALVGQRMFAIAPSAACWPRPLQGSDRSPPGLRWRRGYRGS